MISAAAQAASNQGRTAMPRKVDKMRPYRVDYFAHEEMLRDRALVRSIVVRTVTAAEAKALVMKYASPDDYTVIRAYRFYKKLSPEPKVKKYIPIDKLLPAKKAIEVMTGIENRREPIIIRPEDLDAGHLQPPHGVVFTPKPFATTPWAAEQPVQPGQCTTPDGTFTHADESATPPMSQQIEAATAGNALDAVDVAAGVAKPREDFTTIDTSPLPTEPKPTKRLAPLLIALAGAAVIAVIVILAYLFR